MNDGWFIVWFGCVIAVIFAGLSYSITSYYYTTTAIETGNAEYVILNEKTGDTKFVWKERDK